MQAIWCRDDMQDALFSLMNVIQGKLKYFGRCLFFGDHHQEFSLNNDNQIHAFGYAYLDVHA